MNNICHNSSFYSLQFLVNMGREKKIIECGQPVGAGRFVVAQHDTGK